MSGTDQLREYLSKRIEIEGLRPLAARLNVPVGNLRSICDGRATLSTTLDAICGPLGLEFYIGPPRQGSDSAVAEPPDWTILGDREAPHRGVARCGVSGWGKDVPERDPMPLPEAADDPEAFWVTATGPSMVPEGIEAGGLCLVSPARDIAPGDRVWIRDITGAAAIKRLVSIEDDGRLMLRGWQDFRQGRQQSFDEERFPAGIDRVHPVIAVFKGKPGDERFEHVPDPLAPAASPAAAPPELIAALDLPQGSSMTEAVRAIEERLKDAGDEGDLAAAMTTQMEALRTELAAQMTDTKEAVRKGLADASTLAATQDADPPGTLPVAVVELACAAGSGAKDLSEEVSGQVWFRRSWLDEHGLDASRCAVIVIAEDSMEPTLMDGAKILIDRERTVWRAGDIFVIQTPDGLIVRRAGADADGRPLMMSDNPTFEDMAWPDGAQPIGRVVWTARTLVEN